LGGNLIAPFLFEKRRTPASLNFEVIERMVARDGIEPPTPAFSGLVSTGMNREPANLKDDGEAQENEIE